MSATTTIRDNGQDDWIKFDPATHWSPVDCQVRFFDEDFGATIRFNPAEAAALRDALTAYLEGN